MKQQKLPGDVLKIMKSVDKQIIDVIITTSHGPDEPFTCKMTRNIYNQVMKSTLIYFDNTNQTEGDKVHSGFYSHEPKTTVWQLIYDLNLFKNDVHAKVNGMTFQVTKPRVGHTYA